MVPLGTGISSAIIASVPPTDIPRTGLSSMSKPILPSGLRRSIATGTLRRGILVGILAALMFPQLVAADTLDADGDALLPVANNALAFGSVCSGATVTADILLAVRATTHPGPGNVVYADGATITIAVTSTMGAGLSATAPSTTIVLPLAWGLLPNGTLSAAVSSQVSLGAGAPGPFTGSVRYAATGPRSLGGILARSRDLNVTATITDCEPPLLTLPADISVEASSASGAVVTYTASAADAVDGPITPSCLPASGSTFALGTTTVNCSATDAAGNTASGSFTVTVVDSIPAGPHASPAPSPTPSPTPMSNPAASPTTRGAGSLPDSAAKPRSVGTVMLGLTLVALGLAFCGVRLGQRRTRDGAAARTTSRHFG